MIRVQIFLVLLLTLLVDTATAGKWLENREPEELYAYVDVTGCPISVDELRAHIGEEFVRSRIKLLTEWVPGELALYVTADCTDEDDALFIFNTTVMLARLERHGRDGVVFSFRHEDQIQSYGKGRRDFIRNNVTSAIAVIRVSFSLTLASVTPARACSTRWRAASTMACSATRSLSLCAPLPLFNSAWLRIGPTP